MSHGQGERFVPRLLILLSGPLIWFAQFSVLYGGAGFGAAFNLSAASIRALSWTVTLLACAAVTGILCWQRGEPLTAGLAGLAFVAIVYGALVLWMIPPL